MADARIPTNAQAAALAKLEPLWPDAGTTSTMKLPTSAARDRYIPGIVAGSLHRAGWAKRSRPEGRPFATHWEVTITVEGKRALARWRRDRDLMERREELAEALAPTLDRWELGDDEEPVFVTPSGDGIYFSELGHRSVPPVLAARARAALVRLIRSTTT